MEKVTITTELKEALKELLNELYSGAPDFHVGGLNYNVNLGTIDVEVDGVELNIGESTMTLQVFLPMEDTIPCWTLKEVQQICHAAGTAWQRVVNLATEAGLDLE